MSPFALALAVVLFQGSAAPASKPASAPAPRPGVAELADGVVAIINDDVITKSEVDALVRNVEQTLGARETLSPEQQRRREMQKAAIQVLYRQAAKKVGIDEASVDEEVKRTLAKEASAAGSETKLRMNLESQGKSWVEHERDLKNREIAQRLRYAEIGFEQRPETEIVITPAVVRAYYHEHLADFQVGPRVRGRMILLSDLKHGSHKEALAKAIALREEIAKGADFARTAREQSEWKALDGGLIDWTERGKGLEAKVEEFLFAGAAGALSEPIELATGVAIVRLDAKQPAGPLAFHEPETQKIIYDKLWIDRSDQILMALTKRLRAEAYVWPADLFTLK